MLGALTCLLLLLLLQSTLSGTEAISFDGRSGQIVSSGAVVGTVEKVSTGASYQL